MPEWTSVIQRCSIAAAMGAAIACADVLTHPVVKTMPTPRESPGFNVVNVGGQDFYPYEGTGELVPTEWFAASIRNEQSAATITCSDENCNATFSTSHEGMWHWTKQTLRTKILEGGSGVVVSESELEKTGGTSCMEWLSIGFCAAKKQSNEHSGSATVQGCSARATLETMHKVGWGVHAAIEIPVIGTLQTMNWGERSRSTFGEGFDEARCSECDNPSTPEVEDCGAGDAEQPQDSGTGSGGGEEDCLTCVTEPTTCAVRYWYNRATGDIIALVVLYCW